MPSRDPVRMLRRGEENKFLLLPDEIFNATEKDQDDLNTRYLKFSGETLEDDEREIKVGFSEKSDQLLIGRKIGLSGVTNIPELFDGTKDIDIQVLKIPVSILEGIISPENLPSCALERLYPVDNDTNRFSLTKDQVQNGDIVKVKDTGLMYLVKDDTKLNLEDGYEIYKAGWAAAVPWTGVTDKPISYDYNDSNISNIASIKAVNDLYKNMSSTLTDIKDNWLKLTGGTMKGNIAMSSNKITGLGSGTADADAANIADVTRKIEEYITYYLNKTY